MPLSDRFDFLEQLYEGRASFVHRARELRDGAPVLLKVQKPGSAARARLRHEYGIRERLDGPGFVRARELRELTESGNDAAIVLEDPGGETLAARLARGRLPLPEALRVAGDLAGTLGQLHHARIIHKDINPGNVLLDAGGRARLFDFELATCLPREIQGVITPEKPAGRLPRLSPEQTGRMNLDVDHRADLCCLGVTLYAALTGAVPFATLDPIELIHSPLAKVPVPPKDIEPRVPEVVSDLVMKLLERNAEARYQSARGLKADLEECQRRLTPEGRIEPFPLGSRDVSDRLHAPQALVTSGGGLTAPGSFDMPSMIKASQALSSELALDSLLLRLMDLLAENAGAERGALVQKQGDTLTVAAEFDVRGGSRLPPRAVPLDESTSLSQAIVTYVIRTRTSVVLANAASEGVFTGDAYVIQRQPRAILCAPLAQKGEVCGALYLENNLVPGAFTPERAELLSVLCAQMAISIDNAQLHAELDRKVRESTGALEAAQARLLKIEKETTEMQMAGGFAHEMRNALAGAKLMLARVYRPGSAETGGSAMWSACLDNSDRMASVFLKVRDHVPEGALDEVARLIRDTNASEEQVHEILRGMGQALDRGLGITKLILDYSHLGREERGEEQVSVSSLVDAVLLDLRDDLAQKHIALRVDVPAGQMLVGSELHFHSILGNLVLNARDALLEVVDDRPLEIGVWSVVERGGLVLSVSDTGVGIPAEFRGRVFDPFFSTKPRTGTGLGLAMVRKLALLYDADIELESVLGRSTTFRVVFPGNRVVSAL